MTRLPSACVESPPLVLRDPEEVCSLPDLGGARSTRHSFTRQLLRELGTGRWRVDRTLFDLDDLGRGTAAYEVRVGDDYWMTLVLFSQIIDESARTDRVIAETWDVTGALIEGRVSAEGIAELRPQVTVQEEGRALLGTMIWGRANRSVRFFDQVVRDLAAGRQPRPDTFGLSPYLLRSTAFYSNGKFGIRDFEGYTREHVFSVPYRSHMLTAWLFREFSYDLAGDWSRYLGLGNATGLGLVPYIVNHPEILNAWLWSREYPLAAALARTDAPGSSAALRVVEMLDHFGVYLAQQGDEAPESYRSGATLSAALDPLRTIAREYFVSGTMHGETPAAPWHTLHDAAAAVGPEIRGVVASALTELTGDLDDTVQAALVCVEDSHIDPAQSVSGLRAAIAADYGWIESFDFGDAAQLDRFWFTSANSEEPRRGNAGEDPGLSVQHGVNVAEEVWRLRETLREQDGDTTVAEFLITHPRARAAVSRVQKVGPLPYGELRANLRSSPFLPLHPQRVQLAVYGMENYNPQSTDWLRVTLFSGAPRVADVDAGRGDDDWMFPLRPRVEEAG